MIKVRTTMQPWLELEVSPQEYVDLDRQGLLQGKTKTPDLQGMNIPAPSSTDLPEGTRAPGEGA